MKPVFTFLLCFLFTTNVLAVDIPREAITWKGTSGLFFSEAVATKILMDLETFNSQAEHIKLLDTKLELMNEKVLLLEQSVVLADKIADKYKINYELENKLRVADAKAYEKELSKKTSFWRSPGLWFGIGFVVAGALAVGISFSLQNTRE